MSDQPEDNPAPENASEILLALREHVTSAMTPRFRKWLIEMGDHLFSISGSAQLSSEKRTSCFEAFSVLKRQNKTVQEQMVSRLQSGMAHLGSGAESLAFTEPPEGKLDLVDLDEFEDRLAIDKIVKAGGERYWLPWEAIVFRVAPLVGCAPEKLTLPISIKALCDNYRDNIQLLGFDRFIIGELDRAYARSMLPEIGTLYGDIGEFLAERGLQPDLEAELEASGSRFQKRADAPKQSPTPSAASGQRGTSSMRTASPIAAAGNQPEALQTFGGTTGASAPGQFTNAETALVAGSGGGSAAPVMQPIPQQLDPQRLFSAPSMTHQGASFLESDEPLIPPSPLDAAAGEAGQVSYLPGRGAQQLGRTVDNAVLQRLQTGAGYGGPELLLSPEELAARSREVATDIAALRRQGVVANSAEGGLIEQLKLDQLGPEAEPLRASVQLVEDLYGTFREALNVGDGMSANIDLLKLPLAELSLLDPGFLKDREHPARLLVERLSELASLSPNNNPRMESKVGSILSGIHEGYDGDVAVFDTALTQVTELALGLLKQQQRNIHRQIAAEEGRAKRDDAAEQVELMLGAAIPNPQIALSLLVLIDQVLRDFWTLSAVRGADEGVLQRAIEPAAHINSALVQRAEGGDIDVDAALALVQSLRERIDDSGYMPPEQVALFDAVAADLTGTAAPELTYSTLGYRDRFAEPDFSQRLEKLPRLRRWVRRARELDTSAWVVESLADGQQRNLQLIWQSPDKTHYAFANEQGQKVREVDVVQLAHWLSTRLSPLNPSERLSIIERSVFSTLARKQAALSESDAASTDSGLDRSGLADRAQSMLRRARRRGASHTAIAIHIEGDGTPEALHAALEAAGVSIIARGQLSPSTQGLIVDTSAADRLQQALQTGLRVGADAGIGITVIDPEYGSADELWAAVEETAKRGLALSPNTGVLAEREARPTDLAGAVRNTLQRLQTDMPPRLSLRRILRTRTSDSNQIEEAFQVLLDGMPDAGGELARNSGFHSSALAIALDCMKVSTVCRIAEDLNGASRAVPVFNLRLSTDAALHDDFLEFVLNQVSQTGIGTDRLCLEFRDSSRLREEPKVADFARTLRSIGCLIGICDVNPSRGSTSQLQVMNPHMLALDASLWPPAEGGQLPSLHQAISDLHHLVGEHVVLRDNRDRPAAAHAGIDFVEFFDPDEIDPAGLAEHLPLVQR